jgi:N-acetyl-alpha-D-glucosaminyl L-malate synthase BshA
MMSYPLFEHQPYTLALATKMANVAESEKPRPAPRTLRHPAFDQRHPRARVAEAAPSLPVVTTLHGTDITLVGADRSYLPITRYGIAQSDGVTAISNYLKRETEETFGYAHAEVIPNFVCGSEYRRQLVPQLRAELSPQGEPLLVHVSNFRPVKRPVDCVEILARVRERGIEARLVMVGDGSERGRAEHRARSLGLESFCTFVGKQPRIVDYLSAADVLLLPSEQESFGLAALEAMACEVRSWPRAWRRARGRDRRRDGLPRRGRRRGKMARTPRAFVGRSGAREMGARARRSAVERYSTDLVIPQYIDFYERVIAASKQESRA